jgi:quercetin dioxygenase-like cupin family protein
MLVSETWYHGSPYRLSTLREGSTITRERHLAEVFSHKPPIVSIGDDGTIRHNGTAAGYLYRVVDPVAGEDVYPHPRSSMPPGKEWLTRRELRVELIGPVQLREEERLSEQDLKEIRARLAGRDRRGGKGVGYIVRKAAEAEAARIAEEWGSLNWLANAEIGNAEGVTVGRVTIRPGQANPRHSHSTCEEVLYLLSGRLAHRIGNASVILEAGDTLTVPANVAHYAANVGDEDADMIVAYSSGERDFHLEP